jgi:hypothetical protein
MKNTDKLNVNSQLQLNFTNRFYDLTDDFYQYQLPTDIKHPYLIHINPLIYSAQ